MKKIEQYTAQNRRAWDEIAVVREHTFEPAAFFAQGGCHLGARTLEIAGDVRGVTLCHLQCATGEDTLSWANKGALATGIDISPRQIALAQQKAAQADLDVRFIAADIYALPSALLEERFDIIFTGGGALVWLPELSRWAQTIANLLSPCGRLILDEEHPLAGCMEVEDGKIKIVSDYFARKADECTGWTHFSGGEGAVEPKYEFTWPLGDVVTSLAQAGLRIELLEERPGQAQWRYGDMLAEAQSIPGAYLLVARREL